MKESGRIGSAVKTKRTVNRLITRGHRRCIVCGRFSAEFFAEVRGDFYRRCTFCRASFLNPAQRQSPEKDRELYLKHNNDSGNEGYRKFLSRLADPLLERLPPESEGLDYGCGPGPALALMLAEKGHRIRLFDPFFFPDPEALDDSYDFITCTETIEHFHRPAEEFARLDGMLKPGGLLALMTCFQNDEVDFASWHYRRDPTHVVFYNDKTMRYIADRFGWTCEIPIRNLAFMQKSNLAWERSSTARKGENYDFEYNG